MALPAWITSKNIKVLSAAITFNKIEEHRVAIKHQENKMKIFETEQVDYFGSTFPEPESGQHAATKSLDDDDAANYRQTISRPEVLLKRPDVANSFKTSENDENPSHF